MASLVRYDNTTEGSEKFNKEECQKPIEESNKNEELLKKEDQEDVPISDEVVPMLKTDILISVTSFEDDGPNFDKDETTSLVSVTESLPICRLLQDDEPEIEDIISFEEKEEKENEEKEKVDPILKKVLMTTVVTVCLNIITIFILLIIIIVVIIS